METYMWPNFFEFTFAFGSKNRDHLKDSHTTSKKIANGRGFFVDVKNDMCDILPVERMNGLERSLDDPGGIAATS
jgi:hypothetical protein